jgi:hypothetical protein
MNSYNHPRISGHNHAAIHGSMWYTAHPEHNRIASLALCEIRPPRMVEVQILQAANICPPIRGYKEPGHKKTPTVVGVSRSLLGDEPRAVAIP